MTTAKRFAMLRPDVPIIAAAERASTMAAEQFRTLAVQVEQGMRPKATSGGYVLAITSPEPGTGKTLTSLNLVLTLAPPGTVKRMLLIECDMWHPSLRQYLDVDPGIPGLYQLLKEEVSFEEAKVPLWASMVDVIFAGRGGEVGNLLSDQRMDEILRQAREEYEIVILDSPPFFLASGRSLSALADSVLVLARAGHTRKKSIEDLLSAMEPDKVLGMSLTCVPERHLSTETGGAYSYYAYQSEEA